jgi:hypothetical protein
MTRRAPPRLARVAADPVPGVARAGAVAYPCRMRTWRRLLPVALVILVATPARAQHGGYGGGREREGRRQAPTHADSTRTLAGPWQIWTHGGVGWLGSPADVRTRYSAGLDVGISGDRRLADRIALRARIEYHDVPSSQPTFVGYYGGVYPTTVSYGNGWFGSALSGIAVRAWNHLWLEGGAGGGYFDSGFPSSRTIVNPATGATAPIAGGSGWGGVWSAGARYEFKPNLRDRILAEVQFYSMDRDGTTLHFWAVRAGYRAF